MDAFLRVRAELVHHLIGDSLLDCDECHPRLQLLERGPFSGFAGMGAGGAEPSGETGMAALGGFRTGPAVGDCPELGWFEDGDRSTAWRDWLPVGGAGTPPANPASTTTAF